MRLLLLILNKYLPLLFWCLTIFLFSSQPKTLNIGPNYWTDFFVKKLAHIIEYGILAIFAYRAFNKSKLKTLIFVLLYGISDEIHQSLVPGREPRVRDVFIDLLGGFFGLWLIKYLPPKVQKKLGI